MVKSLIRSSADFVRKHGRKREATTIKDGVIVPNVLGDNGGARHYVAIHERNAYCIGCQKKARSLFMGVCSWCEARTFFTPVAGQEYLCWQPRPLSNLSDETLEYMNSIGDRPDNPAYALRKWWVRVA